MEEVVKVGWFVGVFLRVDRSQQNMEPLSIFLF